MGGLLKGQVPTLRIQLVLNNYVVRYAKTKGIKHLSNLKPEAVAS